MSTTTTAGRTYGNWRRPRSQGLYGQSTAVTYTGIGALIVALLLVVFVSPAAGLVFAGLALLVIAPLMVRINGRTAYQSVGLRWQWSRHKRRRAHVYRSGPLSAVPNGSHRLPGLLAHTHLYEGEDPFGRTFGMIHAPKEGNYTVVLRAEPQGAALVGQTQVDTWVSGWGRWLGELGQTGDIVGTTVVIDTSPDSGERLRAEVNYLLREDAPALAREILTQTAQEYPTGSAVMSARVAITFKAGTAEHRTHPEEMAVEIGTRLPELYMSLREAGLDATPMDGWAVAETVRVAYDPAAQQLIDEARGSGDGPQVVWADVGPAAHHEKWGSYVHDSGVSVTFAMEEAPRGTVREQVLRRLLEPHRDLARKRITLIYRPHSAGDAATIVDRDFKDAIVGAEEDLRRTESVLRNLASTARLRVRPCYGYQAAAFAAGLGIGVLLPEHATIPGALAN